MNINKFALKVTKKECGKKQVDIAQIKEVLSVVNKLTGGVLYAVIKVLPVLMLMALPVSAQDQITATLLDHVMTVTQFHGTDTRIALVDSVVQLGSVKGKSIFDLQAGFSGDTNPDAGDPSGINYIAGGFLKVSSLLNTDSIYPEHWKFLRAIEHGPVAMYDFRTKEIEAYYQAGLAFGLAPK